MTEKEEYILSRISTTIKSNYSDAEVILFGSRARGTPHSESDWDILVLLNRLVIDWNFEIEFMNRIYDLELEVGEAISAFVYSKQTWETKYSVTPFYENVMSDGIVLK